MSSTSTNFTVQSHTGPYSVRFENAVFSSLAALDVSQTHFIIDRRVAEIYRDKLELVLDAPSKLVIDATETNKSLDRFSSYVEQLVANGIRRGHRLMAIGGGIMQDITCFLSATLLRGLRWDFYPTTLLAQADSCIGSKSSINVGKIKNILGTFTPPREITICLPVLASLELVDLRSGIGEMLKVHLIDGLASFAEIAADYPQLLDDPHSLQNYIYRSLMIKKAIIEADEFDTGLRNIMNYGHSFGHAIESATNFEIPHGIAITIGMDMANSLAAKFGLSTEKFYRTAHPTLASNYSGFESTVIDEERFLSALAKDKKNTDDRLALILPDQNGRICRQLVENTAEFRTFCRNYLATGREL